MSPNPTRLGLFDVMCRLHKIPPEWKRPFLSLLDLTKKAIEDEKAPRDVVVALSNELATLIRDRRTPRYLREMAETFRDWLLRPYLLSPAFRKVSPRGPQPIPKEKYDAEALEMLTTYEDAWNALKDIFARCSKADERFRQLAAQCGKDNVPLKGEGCYRGKKKPSRDIAMEITARKHDTTERTLKRRLARARKIRRYRA